MERTILERVVPDALQNRKTAKARESFWAFCKLMNPKFYKDSRPHLRELADTLQALHEGKLMNPNGTVCKRLAISEPPRHGKSYILTLFNQWVFGRNHDERIINVSYNETLSIRFSKGVRDGIAATKIDPRIRVYADVFPGVKIKDGDAAAQMWSLQGSYFSFLGAGMGGTITGMGCSKLIIDDPVKNHIEAFNDRLLDEQFEYYTNTLLSRVEEGGIIIIVMTRWSTRDLVGRVLEMEPEKWHVLRHPACLDEEKGKMLCPELLSFESYQEKKRMISQEIFQANYQNSPVNIKGRLYNHFATYEHVPEIDQAGNAIVKKRVAYVDTADTGKDYVCGIVADKVAGEGYILDVVYTDEPMEVTEKSIAKMLFDNQVQECVIESNNGGRGFARNVERLLWELYGWRGTLIIWHNQRQNKEARILTESNYVQTHLLFPENWKSQWPQYAAAMTSYQRKGKNAHDDAPDTTTGLAEYIQRGASMRSKFFSGRGRR